MPNNTKSTASTTTSIFMSVSYFIRREVHFECSEQNQLKELKRLILGGPFISRMRIEHQFVTRCLGSFILQFNWRIAERKHYSFKYVQCTPRDGVAVFSISPNISIVTASIKGAITIEILIKFVLSSTGSTPLKIS